MDTLDTSWRPPMLMTPYSYPMSHHSHSFVSKNGWKWLKTGFDNTYLHNLLFYTQICSMGQQVVFNYPMVSPKVPTTLATQNGRKWLKTGFDDTFLLNLLFYTQVCSMGLISVFQLFYGITQGAYKHLWPYTVSLWVTIVTHLWAIMAENGSKQVYDDTYLHNL
jgi:hypothetical protein